LTINSTFLGSLATSYGIAPQASPHILRDIKEPRGRRVIPEGIVGAA
jgi:hypothetical protein